MSDLRALTVRQPWAWAIVHGGKDVENRTWPTSYRGRLIIHAGGKLETEALAVVESRSDAAVPASDEFVRGAIIGTVELVDCVRDSDSVWAQPDHWHWLLRQPRPLRTPYPCVGKLGLWRPPADVLHGLS